MRPSEDDTPPTDGLAHNQRRARRPSGAGKLTRRAGPLGGVASGIAYFVGGEPRTVRWLLVVTTLLSLGIGALIYALLWLLLPANDSGTSR